MCLVLCVGTRFLCLSPCRSAQSSFKLCRGNFSRPARDSTISQDCFIEIVKQSPEMSHQAPMLVDAATSHSPYAFLVDTVAYPGLFRLMTRTGMQDASFR